MGNITMYDELLEENKQLVTQFESDASFQEMVELLTSYDVKFLIAMYYELKSHIIAGEIFDRNKNTLKFLFAIIQAIKASEKAIKKPCVNR